MTTKRKKTEFIIFTEDDRNPDHGWHWPRQVPSLANSGLAAVLYFDLYNIRAGVCENIRISGPDCVEGIHAMSGERCSPQPRGPNEILPAGNYGRWGRV